MTSNSSTNVAYQVKRDSAIVSTMPVTRAKSLTRRPSERHQVMKIQNYVIYRKTIGAGSMGKVKLAECLTDLVKQKYAVKIMPKVDLLAASENKSSASKDPKDTPQEREQRTIREMAIMRLLRHPNICQLKEYITEGDKYYMFLEYVDGGQLLDYIVKHGKLKEKQARKFARQIVSALDYCHRNSIVHRDLKIENILITSSEQLKIIDFGLSNVYSPTQQLNTFCGSLYFAAPELLRARQYTGPEVDVWSFGVVLYVLVCGKVPFDDSNLPALHEKIKSGIVDDYPDHLGKDCIDLLHKIFVVDPAKRITLSAIQSHPFMNKGYDEAIRNYLPHRQPLEKIDMGIINGMDGFGLGSPQEISDKLQKIISSAAYQTAAVKIDENYQKKATQDQTLANRPRWKRSLSTNTRPKQVQDDFQSLPAMYDPLVSIYYLVKERKETDRRRQQILNPGTRQGTLSRSTSTMVFNTSSNSSTNKYDSKNNSAVVPTLSTSTPATSNATKLRRRRTFDAAKKLPSLPDASSMASPTITITESSSKPSLSRKKSLQIFAKKIGIKLPSATSGNNNNSNKNSNNNNSGISTTSNNGRRSSNWLKLELSSSNTLSPQQNEKKRLSTGSTIAASTPLSSSWKRLSITRNNATNNNATNNNAINNNNNDYIQKPRASLDSFTWRQSKKEQNTLLLANKSTSANNISSKKASTAPLTVKPSVSSNFPTNASSVKKPTIVVTSSKSESLNKQPKSLFNLNKRERLFNKDPKRMMEDLVRVLKTGLSNYYQVKIVSERPPYQLHCIVNNQLKFRVTIYEAMFSHGKLGIKLKDEGSTSDDGRNSYHSSSIKHFYKDLYNEITKGLDQL